MNDWHPSVGERQKERNQKERKKKRKKVGKMNE